MTIHAKLAARPLPRYPDGTLASSTMLGGYPIAYFLADTFDTKHRDIGQACPECARNARDYGHIVIAADVMWEGPADYCEFCYAEMHTAYGDPYSLEDAS
jgi:hypothetical protein